MNSIEISNFKNFCHLRIDNLGRSIPQPHSYKREFGIRNTIKKLNRQLEKAADSFGNITDI